MSLTDLLRLEESHVLGLNIRPLCVELSEVVGEGAERAELDHPKRLARLQSCPEKPKCAPESLYVMWS